MNTAEQVNEQIKEWTQAGLLKTEVVIKLAKACIGWPYIYGAAGQYDTPRFRQTSSEKYSKSKPDEAAVIIKKCQVANGTKGSCDGCKWYPKGKTRSFDCRGFTRWVLSIVKAIIKGAGATSQWDNDDNWLEKGEIDKMPLGAVCCVFQKNGRKMGHTGIHIGGGNIIHCSGDVKEDTIANKHWTHYAIPKNMEGVVPVSKPTIKKGSKGEYVILAQQELISLGYDVGAKGADGIFGTATQTAVKKFQTDHQLKADGIVGSKTWEALDGAIVTEYYKVTIPHLPLIAAQELVKQYPNSTMEKE